MLRNSLVLPAICIALVFSSFTPALAKDASILTDDKKFPTLISVASSISPAYKQWCDSIYDHIGLMAYGLDREVFYKAYKGYQYLLKKKKLRKSNLLTICDYSQSSNSQRLYVIDLNTEKLLYNTFVAHGKNSGDEFANSFSNLDKSNKSSLGFMVTAETYVGKAGLSLRFDGAEKGINDLVRTRDIVLHGSTFVSNSLRGNGTISKSLGCPAVPFGIHKKIIALIKGGSCFYINHPDRRYTASSPILNAQFVIPELEKLFLTQTALQEVKSVFSAITYE